MKRVKKVVFCGMIASLVSVLMLASHFPYLSYSVSVISSVFIMIVVIEMNEKWAFFCFLASLLPVLLFAEPASKLLYAVFFGYYPVTAALIERIRGKIPQYLLKFVLFNGAMLFVYFTFSELMGFADTQGFLLHYGKIVLPIVGNIIFILYEIMLTRFANEYKQRYHKIFLRLLK